MEESVEIPVDGILDLHTFNPREVSELIACYIDACREKEIFSLRIIHGKGTGALRRTVHAALEKNQYVVSFSLAPENAGGWGATIVELKNRP